MDKDKDRLSTAERVDVAAGMACMYLFFGFIVTVAMFGNDAPEVAQGIAVILFWPLFVIKYALIGIYLVLEAGLELLV